MPQITPAVETLPHFDFAQDGATSLQPQLAIPLPASMLFDPEIPPAALQTWARLSALAAGSRETPPLPIKQLCAISGKTRSTLYRHLAALRDREALSWRLDASGRLIISFPELGAGDLGADPQNRETESQNRDCDSHFREINSQKREKNSHFRESDSQKRDWKSCDSQDSTAESQKCENFSQNCDSPSLKTSLINNESLKIKERGHKFAKTRKATPENGAPTAAKLYRRLARVSPNPTQREKLSANVSDLHLWEASLRHWLAHGWNPRNLQGMLELYERGGPAGCRYCHKGSPLDETYAILDSLAREYANE